MQGNNLLIFSITLNLVLVLSRLKTISSFLHYVLFLFGYGFVSIIPSDKSRIIAYQAQQLFILRRICNKKKFRLTKTEKLTLITFGRKIKNRIKYSFILSPNSLIKWHRTLIRRRWTYDNKSNVGRPSISSEVEKLIIQISTETDWGYKKIKGELKDLGYKVSVTTIKNVLKRYGIPISSRRKVSGSWREFIRHYKELMLASDFFTVDTGLFRRFYVLFFKEIRTRKILFAACTEHPTGEWATQQARHLAWQIQDKAINAKYLIRDQDDKYTDCFDKVFESEGIEVIETSDDAPLENSYAERFVRSIREECLDKIIIINQIHLDKVLKEYINYFNTARPHQGIDNQIPERYNQPYTIEPKGKIFCRKILGGIIKDYFRVPVVMQT